ncbi:MAG: hypothetical protein ABJD24_12535 [Acidimicrobiales bacterium]
MMHTPSDRRRHNLTGWLRASGAILVVGLVAAGCSSSAGNSAAISAPVNSGSSTTGATAAVPGATTAPTAPGETVPPHVALTAALDALAPGYQFDSNASLGDSTPLSISGRVIGSGSDLAVTNGGVTLEYVQVPPQAWARDQKGDWVELTTDVPVSSPLDSLKQPTKVDNLAESAAGRHLQATYPASALGGAGTDPVVVDVVIGSDGSVTAIYPATVGAQQATITSILRPAADTSPITAPAVVSPGSG